MGRDCSVVIEMKSARPVSDEDLNAYIDGQLPHNRQRDIERLIATDDAVRVQVIPAQRGRRTPVLSVVEGGEDAGRTAAAGHATMTWAQRLRRVFKIDIETCGHCGGATLKPPLLPPLEAFSRIWVGRFGIGENRNDRDEAEIMKGGLL